MTIPMHHPGPREGFDEGSVEEMAQESHEVHIDVVERRPWGHPAHHDIEVPDDASALIEGFAAYGSCPLPRQRLPVPGAVAACSPTAGPLNTRAPGTHEAGIPACDAGMPAWRAQRVALVS